jgi:hypothetical protein
VKLSFFDDADEPRTPPRSRRPQSGGRASSGRRRSGGGRPPSDQQALQRRRLVAAGIIIVLIILIALGVHSCQVSARNSALKSYTNHVSSLNQQSVATGASLFKAMSPSTPPTAPALQEQINQLRDDAQKQLASAEGLDVPSEMSSAQRNFLLTLEMRRDGLTDIAKNIEPALGTSTSKDAIDAIALDMAHFYASDVVYKSYTVTLIAAALNNAGIAAGGANGQPIDAGQFLPNLQWLQPPYVAAKLNASLPSSSGSGKAAPGLHGHSLDSVSVAGTTLQTGSTNTIPASPPATFTLHFTNGGTNNETDVKCRVTVNGTSISGTKVVPTTTAGSSTTCDVVLSAAPTPGTYQVKAEVLPVPGEKNVANNTLSYSVTFQ